MIEQHPQAPAIPTAAIIIQVAWSDWDGLAGGGGAAGEREHQDPFIGKQSAGIAAADAIEVWFKILVRRHRHLPAKVIESLDAGKTMIAAKAGVGLSREDAAQK